MLVRVGRYVVPERPDPIVAPHTDRARWSKSR